MTVNDDPNVDITWTAPASDGGSALISYRVRVKSKTDGIYYSYVATCPGTDITQLTCSIPMTALLTTPFNLQLGDLVVAVVDALNAVDYSIPSPENTSGALARTIPLDPTSSVSRGVGTSTTQLVIVVPTQTQDGGSPLLSYGVEIDSGSGFQEI